MATEASKKTMERRGRSPEGKFRHSHNPGVMFRNARDRARRLDLPFDIVHSDVVIPNFCPVLGIPIFYSDKRSDNTPSLDRVVPEKGYIKGNIQVISDKANRLKQENTVETLEAILTYIRNNS